jgi:ABC-2 type transport system permease protein
MIVKNSSSFLLIILFILSLGFVYYRIDLTKDKRYSLTETSKKIIQTNENNIQVDVYLKGEFPASFKQLQNETKNLLIEFQNENSSISYKFIDPIEEEISEDTLTKIGVNPSILTDVSDGKVQEIKVFPYAVFKNKNKKIAVPLFTSKQESDPSTQLNRSIEELEYKFTHAIQKLTENKRKKIGFLTTHQELKPQQFLGFMELANKNFQVGPYFPKDTVSLKTSDIDNLKQIDVLVIAKPRTKFQDEEKVVLDQYLMKGGKLIWFVDFVNAEMDSLYKSDKILAFPYDLNLNDYFFSYGIRINSTLAKDYQNNSPIRLVTGEIQGNPQFSNLNWSYFPLGIDENSHLITKNINPVKFEFASPIELLPSSSIKKTILYQTSAYTSIKQTPNYVELAEVQMMNDSIVKDNFIGNRALAVLLEGTIPSAYKNRIENQSVKNFTSQTSTGKMIVVSDGDVPKNGFYKGEPLPLGFDMLINKQFGNPDFIENCLEYLTDENNLLELRNRTLELQLLNNQEITSNRTYWKYLNLFIPLIFILFIALTLLLIRKKLYSKI